MIPLAEILPHRPPSIVLDEAFDFGEEGCAARFRVPADSRYLDAEGALPAWVGLEMMAQAASAFSGQRHRAAGRPVRIGYLLGTRSFSCAVPSFPVGAELEVRVAVRFLDEEGGPSAFDCELRRGGEVLARATLKAIEAS